MRNGYLEQMRHVHTCHRPFVGLHNCIRFIKVRKGATDIIDGYADGMQGILHRRFYDDRLLMHFCALNSGFEIGKDRFLSK